MLGNQKIIIIKYQKRLATKIEDTDKMNTEIPKDYAKENSEKSLMFTCQWGSCSQMFATVSELSSHLDHADIPFNSDDGKWICKWSSCSKSNHVFKSRYRLVRHMLIHTGAKPHACDICPKTFARLENLKIHKRIHTGEKPFECRDENCQKRFSNSSDRIKHERSHKDNKYKCPSCDFICFTPQTVAKHHKKAHGTKLPKKSTSCLLQFRQDSPHKTITTLKNQQKATTSEIHQTEQFSSPTNVFLQTEFNSICEESSPTISNQTIPSSPEYVLGMVPQSVLEDASSVKQEPIYDQVVPDGTSEFQFYNYEMYPYPNMHLYSPDDQYCVPSYDQQYQQYLQMSYYNQTTHFQPPANYFH